MNNNNNNNNNGGGGGRAVQSIKSPQQQYHQQSQTVVTSSTSTATNTTPAALTSSSLQFSNSNNGVTNVIQQQSVVASIASSASSTGLIFPVASKVGLFSMLDQFMMDIGNPDARVRSECALYLLPHLPLNHRENAFDLIYTVKKQMSIETNSDVMVLLVRLLSMLALDIYVDSCGVVNYLLSTTIKLSKSKKVLAASLSAIRQIVVSKDINLSLLITTTVEPLLHHTSSTVKRESLLLLGTINKNLKQESEDIQLIMVNFLKDPDYRVREAALKSLYSIFYRGGSLSVNRIYQQATLMLLDQYEQVRLECIKLLWVISNVYPNHILGTINERNKSEKIRLVDDVFKKICNAVNDPSVIVRNNACKLLGCIYDVSLNYLIQTLSKEILFDFDHKGRKKFQIGHSRYTKQHFTNKQQHQQQQQQQQNQQESSQQQATKIGVPEGDIDFMASTESSMSLVDAGATGAFIQGLEDEFYEVRSSAIDSMCELSVRNNEFAQKNIDFLVDIFTDEIESVRINSINSLRKIGKMVTIKEEQLHVILASLENSSSAERQSVHRLLTNIHLSNFQCLLATTQALLVNLQKYPRDLYSIFECLSKIGSQNQFTEFIVEDLLRIDPKFASVEPNMDDIFYVAIMIVILNSARTNKTIISLLPPFWVQHHLYLKDKYPQYFPHTLQTVDEHQNQTINKYQLKLESQEDLSKFLKNTLALLNGEESSLSHQSQGLLELLRTDKHNQILKLIEECERNFWRISNINRILKPTSDFYLMFIHVIKMIINIKRCPVHELSFTAGEKLSKLSYKMQVQFIGLESQIQSILYEYRLVGDVVMSIFTLLQTNSVVDQKQFTQLRNKLQIYKEFANKHSLRLLKSISDLYDNLDSVPIAGRDKSSEPPTKQARVYPQSIINHLSQFLKEYEPSLIVVNNQIKRKMVNILLPAPHEKSLESIDNFPLKLTINGNLDNIQNVESLYFRINISGKTQLHPIPSQHFTPIKPFSFAIYSPLNISLPKKSYPKEILAIGINISELVPIDPNNCKLHARDNFDSYQIVNLSKPIYFNA